MTATYAAGDAVAARQLGILLLTRPQRVLPPKQFGQLYVMSVHLNGVLLEAPKPKITPAWLVGITATLACVAAACIGRPRVMLC